MMNRDRRAINLQAIDWSDRDLLLEIDSLNKLLRQDFGALEIFYGSGWQYTDEDIGKIESAIKAIRFELKYDPVS